MDITVKHQDGGVALLHLEGRLNMASAGDLRKAIADAIADRRTKVAVDLKDVDSIDSSGLGALIGGLKSTRQARGDLRIAGPNEQVRLVLQLTNLERVLAVYEDAETAFDV